MTKRRRKKKLRLGRTLIILLILYVGFILLNQRKLMNELNSKKEKIQLEIETLKAEIDALNEEIENSHSLQFVEKVAREELGMVKPREIIYIDKNRIKKPFFGFRKK
ncbi:MAG: septum formation initiator family protein [Tissierellia bacterium]|nr:septum formation initiator family protein [Tissierellia bacterium]